MTDTETILPPQYEPQTTEAKWSKYQQKAVANGIADTGFIMEDVLPIRVVQDNPVYAGLLEQMDDAIGLVLNALVELELMDETIIIFTSDNGGVSSGDAYATSNLPLRGGKGYQWEGGLRVPYIMSVPWMETPGSVDFPVTGADFLPTIARLTNTRLPSKLQHLDGIDITTLLTGGSLPTRIQSHR